MPEINNDIETPDEQGEPRVVSLQYRALQRVNFASAQNDVAIIEEITVVNPTDTELTDLRITLRSVPPIIRERTWVIDRVAPEDSRSVDDKSTQLDIERLRGLDEAEIGELEFRLEAPGLQTIIEKCRIELLARDEWGGVGDMAQILAAFVSPNDPAIAQILREAARLLEQGGHDRAMNGYQSADPRRAYLLAGSIWSAVTGLGLTYAEPPASFEEEGQKIRGPSRITDERLATCLDSTLFLAAAFEAAGLNPVVFFSKGHAWVGVWLFKKNFGHVTEPDVVAVRKAVQAHELIPIETTLLTKRPAIGFEQAFDEGRRRLFEENRDPEFVMAIDIARARAALIRPLASHIVPGHPTHEENDETVPAALPQVPGSEFFPEDLIEEEPNTPQGRIERWQRKLLDLSLRNRLLNYQENQQTLPLRCPSVAQLEDKLADGDKFQGFSLTDDDPIGNRTVSREEAQRIEEGVIHDAFENGQVVVPLTGREMNNRLLTLYRRAKSNMQEGGTNTLFLAAGFLHWNKPEDAPRNPYRAPLVLIPVKLEREAVQSPFKIAHHEDDTRINSTLLEFLRREFGCHIPNLETLPTDENGINVQHIFEIIRQHVHDIPDFIVVEELALSIFSFAKYLMWKDLVDRSDQLRKNRLVRHLIDGAHDTYRDTEGNTPIRVDEIDRRQPSEFLTPLPADSSQLAAVLEASEGRDFILVGPPGTGKSQTITNIISQCLGVGKTVLFVAEKAAALNVVHRRLVATGLGDAVLELHSNKTDRRSVLTQLERGWNRALVDTEAQWIDVTEQLRLSRDQLNAYVKALHAKGTQGFSVFEAISSVAAGEPPFKISFASKDAHDRQSYNRLVDLAGDLARTYAVVRTGPPLSLICREDWSLQWDAEIMETIRSLRIALDELQHAENALAQEIGLRADSALDAARRARLKALAPRVALGALDLSSVPDMPADRLTASAELLAADVEALVAATSETVATYPLEAVRRMPLEQLDVDWREAQAKLWPASALARRKVRKLLQTYADNGAADPAVDLRALFKMREHDTSIRGNPLVPVAETGACMDADRATEAVRQAIEFRDALTDLGSDVEDSHRFESVASVFASVAGGTILDVLQTYLAAENLVDERAGEFVQKDGVYPDDSSVADFDAGLETVEAERARRRNWAIWVRNRNAGNAAGLGSLVEALEDGLIEEDAGEAFKRAYAAWWLPLAMESSDKLRAFTHWEHEHTIEAFRNLDDQAAQLAPLEVMRRIVHDLPARNSVPRQSELGALRHQLGLQRPSMPIRQLLANLPDSFGKLAPCVLMSPLSIAQYLPADQATFDVVIFDEASQITTWDAIGAIARGNQTIVVGDPKQLPPTNFFRRADDEEDDVPEVERDMPSILDEVSVAGVPKRYLNWHYRSRDEALIAFSNHHYYSDNLVTFPAPSTGSDAIKFHKVDGIYARGGGRVNKVEAKAIAEMVEQRLTAWLEIPEAERHTLGVITFNAEQQSLILDLLDDIRRRNGALEWFFADEREEPVIVKNLENIQGDERDLMLFSVTFGPDLAGKLTMNFGAINHEGGEKRLNVAITRARRELHVFSSIRAEQIDLDRTHAIGVRDLKAFLDYAERGPIALPASDQGPLGAAESPFEEAVANALRQQGWEVRHQIGVSGFRIDLGVVHPGYAGRYLAGIECDGATYHSSATARDRDKVRQAVLEGLGWTILRVWSTDWFQDSPTVVSRLHEQLEQLLATDLENRAKVEDEESRQTAESEASGDSNEDEEVVQPVPMQPEHDQATEDEISDPEIPTETPHHATIFDRDASRIRSAGAESGSADDAVPEADAPTPTSRIEPDEAPTADPARFFDSDYAPVLRRLIQHIVEREGPITLQGLARKVAQAHGWQRTGRRIQSRIQENLRSVERYSEFDTDFVWVPGSHARRIPFRGLNGRKIREVSRTEIASVVDANERDLAIDADPILVLSRHLGIARLSKDARAYLSDCVRWSEENPAE